IIIRGSFTTEERLSFMEYIKSLQLLKTISIVLILENYEAEKVELFEKEGTCTCIVKPFSVNEYTSIVKLILNTQRKIKDSVLQRIQNAMENKIQISDSQTVPVENVQKDDGTKFFDEAGFSKRERMIAREILKGKTDKEIASELGITVQTVMTHNKNIFKKAGVHSRVELMAKVR
ncbi:MAG: response regulator transcription factor, partial [Treponema sp.]|nr:response regulator transcription factor [Treponema sp.]